jgi:hypothetical protein
MKPNQSLRGPFHWHCQSGRQGHAKHRRPDRGARAAFESPHYDARLGEGPGAPLVVARG